MHHNLLGGDTLPNFLPMPSDGTRTVNTWDKEMQAGSRNAVVRSARAMKFAETFHNHHSLVFNHSAGSARNYEEKNCGNSDENGEIETEGRT